MPVATTIPEVLERMAEIDRHLDDEDGVAYFNRLYTRVTQEVEERAAGCTFENEEFLVRLDVHFANLYFDAIDEYERTGRCSQAWSPLFEERKRPHTAPIQFALAGMNAHISHDLPLALSSTCAELGLEPRDDTAEHRDYTLVNSVLGEVQTLVKEWFALGLIARVDDACGRLDDALALWSISTARAVAWRQGQALWRLRDDAAFERVFREALARSVALASRGILI